MTRKLQGEIESLGLEELRALGREWFGFEAPNASTAASLAEALVRHAVEHHSVQALCDAVATRVSEEPPRIAQIRREGFEPEGGPAPGEALGPYALEEELGRGPSATVLRGTEDGRSVRIKVLRGPASRDGERTQRYLSLARAAGGKGQLALPELLFAGEVKGRTLLVHELRGGQTLDRLLAEPRPRTLHELWPLLHPLLTALVSLHARKLVHGSLRAENVLQLPDGEPRVTLLDAGAHFVRTPRGALTPEEHAGELPAARSDLYAFGALLFELVCGRPPFEGSDLDRARARLSDQMNPPSFVAPRGHVEPELDELLLALLDARPASRPADAASVLDVLGPLATRTAKKASAYSHDELDALVAALLEKPKDLVLASLLEEAVNRGANPGAVAGALVVAAESLGATPEARRLFARAAALLESVGDVPGAERAYRHLLSLDAQDESAWAGLERLYREHGRYDRVVEVLLERIEHLAAPRERSRALLRLGEVLETKIDDAEQAVYAYAQAFTADPFQPGVLPSIERLCGNVVHRWTEVLDAASKAVKEETDGEKRHALLFQMSKWYGARAGRQDLAKRSLEAILMADPAHDGALEELARLHRHAQDHRALVQVLILRANAAVGPALARDLRREAAVVLERDLGDPRGAIALYEQIVADDPPHAEANEALCRLYQARGSQESLIHTLERWARSADPAHRPRLLSRLAGALESAREHEKALETYELVLAESPDQLEALTGVSRLAGTLGQHEKRRGALERELRIATSPRQRVRVLEELARLSAEEFLDPEAAVVLYERLLEIEPTHPAALRGLAAAYEKLGRWDAPLASRALDALASSDTPEARARGLLRAGELLEKKGDLDGALDRYRKAVDAFPEGDEAAERLRAMHLRLGDVDTAIALLERGMSGQGQENRRAALGMELARLLVMHRKDMARAEAVARRVVALDPTRAEAHALLGDAARVAGRHAEAARHYGVAVLHTGQLEQSETLRLMTARAEQLAASGAPGEAAVIADEVVVKFPEDSAAWQCAADLSFQHGPPERTAELYQKLLAKFGATAPKTDASRWQCRLGECLVRLGRTSLAMNALQAALDLDPTTTLPFPILRGVYESKGDTTGVERTIRRHLERAQGDERADLLVRQGDLAAAGAETRGDAERSYLEALAVRPLDRRILLRLVDLYTKRRDWSHLVETISRLSEVAPDDEQRAKRLLVAARVAWEEMGDRARALEIVKRAVDLAPSSEEVAIEAIGLRSAAGDTEGLRSLLERQIEIASRASDKGRVIEFARHLAELHLSELHTDEAISVYEAVMRLGGGSAELEDVLSELYASDPSRYRAKAEELHSRKIAQDPFHPEPYRALLRLHQASGNPDGAFCACQALVALERATAEEERLFVEHRSSGELPKGSRLTEEDFRELVVHPEVDPLVTTAFARIQAAMLATRARPLARLGFGESSRIAADDGKSLVLAVRRVADWLGLRAPLLMRSDRQRTALSFVLAEERCLSLSEEALRSGAPPREASFAAAAHLTYFMPGFAARSIVPTILGLKAWLLAAIRCFAPRLPVTPELEGATKEAALAIDANITGTARDWLAEPIGELLARGSPADVALWMTALDRTADRLGFVACGDLPTALSMIRASRDSSAGIPVAERVRELLAYSVSPGYLKLRKRLGLDVGNRPSDYPDADAAPLSDSEFAELPASE